MVSLSVVIPAYNEEEAISDIVRRVLATRDALAAVGISPLEVIVVDDGSRDQTAMRVQVFPQVRLLRHRVNRGYGAALKTGFSAARGDLLAFLDADGTYPPESYPQLCQAALAGADLVIGSRMSGAASEMPAVRRLGNWLFATLLSLVGSVPVADSASGMRVIRREVLSCLYPLPDGLDFTPAMSCRALHEKLNVTEVPICYRERLGRSKLSVVRDGLRFLRSIVWTAFTYNPVRLLGGLGVLSLLLAAALAGSLIIFPPFGQEAGIPPYRLAQVLVLSVAGVSLFSVGSLFNYLVSLFHRRPIRQGLFGRPIFHRPLEQDFGWFGLLALAGGGLLNLVTIQQGLAAPASKAYPLFLLSSGMLVLVGLQLITAWLLVKALTELSERDLKVQHDLSAEECQEEPARPVRDSRLSRQAQ